MRAGQWSTDQMPRSLRGEAVRAMLSQVHLPWSLGALGSLAGDGVDCDLRWRDVGGCGLIECRTNPMAGYRRQSEISSTDGEYLGLLMVLSGREQIRQGEAAVTLGPGDLVLWDSAAPLDFAFQCRLHKITLLIPKERLRRAAPRLPLSGTIALDGSGGLGALLKSHVVALNRLADQIPAGDAPLASDMVIDLLGRLIAPGAPPRDGGDVMARVLTHIEHHLDDPELSPTSIAAALDVTPRYLHMVFAGSGNTVAAHIRDRRLDRMRRDLGDSRLDRLSITEIALRWGFNDAAHASRAFRQRFGMSPSAFRATSR